MRRRVAIVGLALAGGVLTWRRSPWSRAGVRRRLQDGSFWRAVDIGSAPTALVFGGPLALEYIASARRHGFEIEPISIDADSITVKAWRPS